jgi:hypothetical protein
MESSAVTDGEHSESRKHKDTDWKLSVPPRCDHLQKQSFSRRRKTFRSTTIILTG